MMIYQAVHGIETGLFAVSDVPGGHTRFLPVLH